MTEPQASTEHPNPWRPGPPDPWDAHAAWWQDEFTEGADPEYVEQILPLIASRLPAEGRVLDVGCGEGAWRAPLLKLRPKLAYIGFDASAYAIARYGRSRNLHQARFGDFAWLRPCAPVDLLVCSDVLHYLPSRELLAGLPGLAELCSGVAFLETFSAEDQFEGDTEGFQPRKAAWYRRRLKAEGFTAIGSHCWLGPALAGSASALERAD